MILRRGIQLFSILNINTKFIDLLNKYPKTMWGNLFRGFSPSGFTTKKNVQCSSRSNSRGTIHTHQLASFYKILLNILNL